MDELRSQVSQERKQVGEMGIVMMMMMIMVMMMMMFMMVISMQYDRSNRLLMREINTTIIAMSTIDLQYL